MKKIIKDDNDIYIVKTKDKNIEIEPLDSNNLFPVDIAFPSSAAYRDSTIGIIDTGAANTIVSIKALYKNLTDTQYRILHNALEKGADKKPFSSAKAKEDEDGNKEGDITTYFCTLPSIMISGMRIKNFPFYLADDQERSLFLIGYDFISSCDFVYTKNNKLSFYSFDKAMMNTKMKMARSLNLLSVNILEQ